MKNHRKDIKKLQTTTKMKTYIKKPKPIENKININQENIEIQN
jgi:hypothetical protein